MRHASGVAIAWAVVAAGVLPGAACTSTTTQQCPGSPGCPEEAPQDPPRLTVAPPFGLGFDCVSLGCDRTQTLKISNHGDGLVVVDRVTATSATSADFTVSVAEPLPFSIPRDGTLAVTVRYLPSDAEADSGSLRIGYTLDPLLGQEPEPVELPLRTRTLGPAQAELADSELNFGFVDPGQTLSREIVLRNASTLNAILDVSATQWEDGSDPAFTVLTPLPLLANAGEEARIAVRFAPPLAPTSARTFLGTLHLATNDGAQPDIAVPVLGTARQDSQLVLLTPLPGGVLDLGTVGVGSTAEATLELRNTGGSNLLVQPVLTNAEGTGFTVDTVGQLSAGPFEITSLKVHFAPTAGGPALGPNRGEPVLELRSNDPDHAVVRVTLRGFGLLPHATPNVSRIDFGGTVLGWAVAPITVELRNTGAGPLHVASVELEGGSNQQFARNTVSGLPATLLPEDPPLQVVVRFTPVFLGPATGGLVFTTDDPEASVRRVAIAGRGVSCAEGCPLPNATPNCDTGACQIAQCAGTWHDADELPADGCECAEDDGGDVGVFCNAGEKNLGTVSDDGTERRFSGTLDQRSDEDTFWFFAEDSGAIDDLFGDDYDVRIELENTPSGVEFCLSEYEHDAQGQGCHGGSFTQCGLRTFRKDGSWGSEDGRDFTIKVRLTPGTAPRCVNYTLHVRNG